MVAVAVEQNFTHPLQIDQLVAADRAAGWCLDLYGVRAIFQSLTTDGLSSLCVYEAPDTEAIRQISVKMGIRQMPRIWPATVHFDGEPPPEPPLLQDGETTFGLVDRTFDRPREFSDLQAIEVAAGSCLVLHRVRFICSFLSHDKLRMACIYAAPDLEAIRHACGQVDLPFNTVRRAIGRG